MTAKKWILSVFVCTFLLVGSAAVFNYFMDPLWVFNHSHSWNKVQEAFNERQQKVNYIAFHDFDYDTLILGSSRTTYINQNDFENMNAYNFAVSRMQPEEYAEYVDYAKKRRGVDFKYIIVGLDFFGTNANRTVTSVEEKPSSYFRRPKEFLYRYKTLLSMDSLKYSFRNFKNSIQDAKVESYNRDNVKRIREVSAQQMRHDVEAQLKDTGYDNYRYKEMRSLFKELVIRNPDTKFIVFTTPVTVPLFEKMVESGRLPDYERWIRDATDVFGEVYNFMYPNSVTRNLNLYIDSNHFKPEVGTLIARKLKGSGMRVAPEDFGVVVTKSNVDEHLQQIKKMEDH